MANGTLTNKDGRMTGEVRTYSLNLKFWFEKNGKAGMSSKAPQFIVMARAPAGHAFQAGVAWAHDIRRGEMTGQQMFQLTLDDPAFGETPLYFSAFPVTGFGEYEIRSERKRGAGGGGQSDSDAAGPRDDIPFPDSAAA